MSYASLLAMMHQSAQAQGMLSALPMPKWGYVTSFNPTTYAVRVRIEPDSHANEITGEGGVVETNWLPLVRSYGGAGWGMLIPPKANPNPPYGDAVLVIFPDQGQGFAIPAVYNDIEQAPTSSTTYPSADQVPASQVDGTGKAQWGEHWIIGPTGNRIILANDGSVRLVGQDGSYIRVDPGNDKSVRIHTSDGGFININPSNDGSITIQTHLGASLTLAANGTAVMAGSAGGSVSITTSAPAGGAPLGSTNPTAIVTRADLLYALQQFALNIFNGTGANPTVPAGSVQGSVSAVCTQ